MALGDKQKQFEKAVYTKIYLKRSFTKIFPKMHFARAHSPFFELSNNSFRHEISCLEGKSWYNHILHTTSEIYYKRPHDTFIITKLLEYVCNQSNGFIRCGRQTEILLYGCKKIN